MPTKPDDREDDPFTPPISSSHLKTFVTKPKPKGERRKGVFTVMSGLNAGQLLPIPVGKVVTLGRSSECTFAFDDVSLSRVHAQVMHISDEYIFHDPGSTNGSFVNDARMSGPHTLRDGDRVQLGSDTILRFSLIGAAEEEAMRRVYEAAMRDGLTGVYNRKHMDERLSAELAFALRHNTHLTIILLDIDFFKKVNDNYGHLGGDIVLKEVAQRLGNLLRSEDLLARYGGEEFLIAARGIDLRGGHQLAERLRLAIAQTPFDVGNQQRISVTISSGVASLVCCGGNFEKETLINVADSRLYQAKETGRNRVISG
jgi:two-component system, cell cycle response regulator